MLHPLFAPTCVSFTKAPRLAWRASPALRPRGLTGDNARQQRMPTSLTPRNGLGRRRPGCCPAPRWPPRTTDIPDMPNGPGACISGPGHAPLATARPPLLITCASPQSIRKVIMTMRLRIPHLPVPRRSPAEKSSHLVFLRAHGATEAAVTAGETWGHHDGTSTRHHHHCPPGPPCRCWDGPAQPARHRRAHALRGALRRALRPARPRAAGAAGAAARDRGAVAPRRVRR